MCGMCVYIYLYVLCIILVKYKVIWFLEVLSNIFGVIEGKRIFDSDTLDRELISKIYKELKRQESRRQMTQLKMGYVSE